MTEVTDLHRALAEVAQEASAEYSRRNKMRTKEGRREVIAQALAEKMEELDCDRRRAGAANVATASVDETNSAGGSQPETGARILTPEQIEKIQKRPGEQLKSWDFNLYPTEFWAETVDGIFRAMISTALGK